MDTLGTIASAVFASACAIIALWHEYRWLKRLQVWEKTKGRVVGYVDGKPIKTLFGGEAPSEDGPYPEIEFEWKGSAHKFTSGYGGSGIPQIGDEVDILFDRATGNAEHLSFSNRWLFTLIPIVFCALFIWLAFQ